MLSNQELTSQDPCALVADFLTENAAMLATAESCTGGMVAAACTDRAGSSAWFDRGFVTYSNAAKSELLGVDPGLVAAHGAVSEPVARAMAEGAVARSQARFGLATTGVAGPDPQDGFSPGTVHVAVATPERTVVRTLDLSGDRAAIRAATCAAVLREALSAVRPGGAA